MKRQTILISTVLSFSFGSYVFGDQSNEQSSTSSWQSSDASSSVSETKEFRFDYKGFDFNSIEGKYLIEIINSDKKNTIQNTMIVQKSNLNVRILDKETPILLLKDFASKDKELQYTAISFAEDDETKAVYLVWFMTNSDGEFEPVNTNVVRRTDGQQLYLGSEDVEESKEEAVMKPLNSKS